MLIPELDHAAIVQNNLDEYGADGCCDEVAQGCKRLHKQKP